jgi:hypothetical protein
METCYIATWSRTDIISKKSGEPKMMDVDQHLEEIGLGVLIMRNQSSTTLIYLFARTHHRQVSVHFISVSQPEKDGRKNIIAEDFPTHDVDKKVTVPYYQHIFCPIQS